MTESERRSQALKIINVLVRGLFELLTKHWPADLRPRETRTEHIVGIKKAGRRRSTCINDWIFHGYSRTGPGLRDNEKDNEKDKEKDKEKYQGKYKEIYQGNDKETIIKMIRNKTKKMIRKLSRK